MRAVVIHGMGGVGKTSLAQQFAAGSREPGPASFDFIFLLQCSTALLTEQSFDKIARDIDLPGAKSATTSANIMRVRKWLATQSKSSHREKNKRWLLVADNLENANVLLQHLPGSKGCVVVTTRHAKMAVKDFGDTLPIELLPMNDDEAISMFWSLCGESGSGCLERNSRTEDDSKELLGNFGGHPLAIELLCANLASGKSSPSETVKKLPARMRQIRSTDTGRHTHHNLITLWEVQFKAIKDTSAGALLGILSLLSPDRITEDIFDFDVAGDILETVDHIEHEEDVEDGIELLIDLNLIKKFQEESSVGANSANETFFSIHRMVADAYLHSEYGLDGSYNSSFDAACSLVLALYPKRVGSTSHFGRFGEAKLALPHAVCLIDHFASTRRRRNSLKPSPDFYGLVQHTTWFLWELGDFRTSMRYLEIGKAASDKDSHFFGRYCLTEGLIMYEQNNLVRCRQCFDQVELIYTKVLEPTHIGWSQHYNNVALLEYAEGRLEDAEKHFKLAAEGDRVARGAVPDHMELARFAMSLGRIQAAMGHLLDAERLYIDAGREFVLAGQRQGELGAFLSYDCGNLALKMGELDKAEAQYRSCLAVREASTPTHTLVAALHYKLGVVELKRSEPEAAIINFGKALTIADFQGSVGELARTKRRKAIALKMLEDKAKESESLAAEALELGLKAAQEQGQQMEKLEDTDEAFDRLVCGYFR